MCGVVFGGGGGGERVRGVVRIGVAKQSNSPAGGEQRVYERLCGEEGRYRGRGIVFFLQRVDKVLTEYEKKELDINQWVGFRRGDGHPFGRQKKPVIAHNCFTDVLFLHESFISSLKTVTYDEFKTNIHTQNAVFV